MEMPTAAASLRTDALPANRFLGLLRQSISAHSIFWAIVANYYAGYLILLGLRPDLVPVNVGLGLLKVFWLSLPTLLFCIIWLRLYHTIFYDRPTRPIVAVINGIVQYLINPKRMANGVPMLLIMVIFGFIFTDVQAKILTVNPAVWDTTFANWDRVLHFGYQPWQWLQPILGYAPVTFLINLNYNIWLFVMWMYFSYFGFAERPSELRTQFFLSFIVTWIVGGSILATIFASGGPCYYTRLGLSPDPFVDLMAYLRAVNNVFPVWAIDIQDALWRGHLGNVEMSEVSAMPSMHNASTLLFVLASFRISRFWGWVLSVHAVLIFIGSIHLAWHYAVDSYVSWALVLVIWYLMGPVAHWWHSRPVQADFDRMLAAGAQF